GGFQDRCLKPLGHPTGPSSFYRAEPMRAGRHASAAEICFETGDLADAPDMALSAGEGRAYVVADQVERQIRTDHAGPKAEDVDIVILDALPGREGIVTRGRADAAEFVGRDAGAGAAAADQHGPVGGFAKNGLGYGFGVIGVVDGGGGVRAEVD